LHCAANANPEKLVSTILKNNYWLTDEHMDHGQWLISKQFPKMKGNNRGYTRLRSNQTSLSIPQSELSLIK
jgi:hypothetical protein